MGRQSGHPQLAGRRPDLAVDQLEKGRLAGPAGADQEGQLARAEGEVDAIDGEACAVGPADGGCFHDRAQFDYWAHGSLPKALTAKSEGSCEPSAGGWELHHRGLRRRLQEVDELLPLVP